MASSQLARFSKTDVRFLPRNFVVRGQHELLHRTKLVARYFETNPDDVETAFDLDTKEGERRFYTIRNVLVLLESLFPNQFAPLKESLFKMHAFDAFIGAPDRHAMNWGVLAFLSADSEAVRFVPVFDTARGLFREYSDAAILHVVRIGIQAAEKLHNFADA